MVCTFSAMSPWQCMHGSTCTQAESPRSTPGAAYWSVVCHLQQVRSPRSRYSRCFVAWQEVLHRCIACEGLCKGFLMFMSSYAEFSCVSRELPANYNSDERDSHYVLGNDWYTLYDDAEWYCKLWWTGKTISAKSCSDGSSSWSTSHECPQWFPAALTILICCR